MINTFIFFKIQDNEGHQSNTEIQKAGLRSRRRVISFTGAGAT
jgi:hypothetical protein